MLETNEIIMKWALLGVALVTITTITLMMARVLRQSEQLRAWRTNLKRGDLVRTKDYPRARVWVNYGRVIVLQIDDIKYRHVSPDEVYPMDK